MMYPQTRKQITMISNVISGLHKCFSKGRKFCREEWQKRYNFIQIDEDKDPDDMSDIKNVLGLEITAVLETTAF